MPPWRGCAQPLNPRRPSWRRLCNSGWDDARNAQPLLRSVDTQDEARQLRRAANGVAANYRATGLSRSHAEFTPRIGVVLEEADESLGWLDYLLDTGFGGDPDVNALRNEASELRNIFWASHWTARGNDRAGSEDGVRRKRRG